MDTSFTTYYSAIRSRDARFDGRFFMAVLTTGIYCRPVCPAPTPRPENVRIFHSAAAAQEMGYRPCLRCRPENAPSIDTRLLSTEISRALTMIGEGYLDHDNVASLATQLGISKRHLDRLFKIELGVTPTLFAQNRRILFAKKLIAETNLSMTEIAFSSGFSSLRRFNSVIKSSYGCAPRSLRREKKHSSDEQRAGNPWLTLKLYYRPPFAWRSVHRFFAEQALPEIEAVDKESYIRTVQLEGRCGLIKIHHTSEHALTLSVTPSLIKVLSKVVNRVQRMFDLRADNEAITEHLKNDPLLSNKILNQSGVRIPGSWHPYELIVRTLLGQPYRGEWAQKNLSFIIQKYGTPVTDFAIEESHPQLSYSFPQPQMLVNASFEGLDIDSYIVDNIRSFSQTCLTYPDILNITDKEEGRNKLAMLFPHMQKNAIDYILMRAWGESDVLPFESVRLKEFLETHFLSEKEFLKQAENWHPWCTYAALMLDLI